jgi:hypothetical protein
MASSPQPDIRFLRNTGFALVTATLVAGAIMLSLARTESKLVILASSSSGLDKGQVEAIQVAAAAPHISPNDSSPRHAELAGPFQRKAR